MPVWRALLLVTAPTLAGLGQVLTRVHPQLDGAVGRAHLHARHLPLLHATTASLTAATPRGRYPPTTRHDVITNRVHVSHSAAYVVRDSRANSLCRAWMRVARHDASCRLSTFLTE